MEKKTDYIKFSLIGLCAFLFAYSFPYLVPKRISYGINDLSSWYIYNFSKESTKPINIIGIAVDEYSLNKMQQRWPWKRPVYAELIRALDKEKVNTIGIDLAFVGESADSEDDRLLKEALDNVSARVVIAYFFDLKKREPVFPYGPLKDSAYSAGMLNTPIDGDGKCRRLRAYVNIFGRVYNSFAVSLASAYLNESASSIIQRMPLASDRTFLINYLIKPNDIKQLSAYECLNDIEGLKLKYGEHFLKGAFILIYPEAKILHDTYETPLGEIPGGMLHINGVANIVSGRLIKEVDNLYLPFLLFSFFLLIYVLRYCGFFVGLLFTAGILIVDFWGLLLLGLNGIKFDYAYVVSFTVFFFILGNLYKYAYFFTQLIKIKDMATLDPLRNLFTLRYFYYRLLLEMKKIYLGRGFFLVFIDLGAIKEESEEISLEELKGAWKKVSDLLYSKGGFWSVYSQSALVGCLVGSKARIRRRLDLLKSSLGELLLQNKIKVKIKLAYVRIKRNAPIREMLFVLSTEIKKKEEDIVFLKEGDLSGLLVAPSVSEAVVHDKILESLTKDIEARNKELLDLIENLKIEHGKTKEAFYQIISSLVNALEARDSYTEGHSERVTEYSLKLAEKLGWSSEQKEKLRKAGLLHDLGKIGIPDSILHKKGKLDDEEYNFIKQHEIIGVKILEPLKEISDVLPWILYHHERWDGRGYPHGLAGDAIPIGAQILTLADSFDAITTGRDYKDAYSWDTAINEINRCKGAQFNPRLADLFIEVIQSLRDGKRGQATFL